MGAIESTNTQLASEVRDTAERRKGPFHFTFGERLSHTRVEAGLCAADMAVLISVQKKTLWNWERDKILPNWPKLGAWIEIIAERTGIDAEDLALFILGESVDDYRGRRDRAWRTNRSTNTSDGEGVAPAA